MPGQRDTHPVGADLARVVRLGARGSIFPQKFPVIGVISLLFGFFGCRRWARFGGEWQNSGVFRPIPGQIDREFFSTEQVDCTPAVRQLIE
jgi:hypothetical protein